MFENFWGNAAVTESLEQMIGGQRLSQTLLFSGREGVGKATLARRMAARLLGHDSNEEVDVLLSELYRSANSDAMLRRDIIYIMARRNAHYWLSDRYLV